MTSNHGTWSESKRLQCPGSFSSVHCDIISPDFISDPGILQTTSGQPLLNLLEIRGVVTNLVDLPVWYLEAFVMVASTHCFKIESNY